MRLGTIKQQPDERLSYSIGYADVLQDDDTLETVDVTVDPAGELTIDAFGNTTTDVHLWATGGVDKSKYKVEVTVTTVAGRVYQDELIFVIREI